MKNLAKIGFIITILSICLASCGSDDGPALPNAFPGDIIGLFHLVDEGTGKDFFSSNPGYSFEEAIYILKGPTGATLEFDGLNEFQKQITSFKVTEVEGNIYINIPVRVDRPSSSREIFIKYSGEDVDTLSISYEASVVESDYNLSATHYRIEKVLLQFNGQVFEYDLIGLGNEERWELSDTGYKGEFYKAPKG